jgi:malate dehydrogenase
VVGNPANTNALICSTYAPSILSSNFTALTRLDQNRATSLLSDRLGATVESFQGIIIWGNHSATQFADVRHGSLVKDGKKVGIREAVANEEWL